MMYALLVFNVSCYYDSLNAVQQAQLGSKRFSENAVCANVCGNITRMSWKKNSVCWVVYILRNSLECLPAFVPNGSIETVSITLSISCQQVSTKSDKGRTMPVCTHQSYRFHRRKTFAVSGRTVMTDAFRLL